MPIVLGRKSLQSTRIETLRIMFVETILANAHFLFNAEFWQCAATGRAFTTEDLSTCPAMVLVKKQRMIEIRQRKSVEYLSTLRTITENWTLQR